jgi:hypothetical protein
MSKNSFDILRTQVCDIVGKNVFKSEQYISDLPPTQENNIVKAHKPTGGILSGEIKLGLILRMLGGGSYMDIALVFDISFNHSHKIFRQVLNQWILHDSFYPINGVEYCSNEDKMKAVALQFSASSGGVINGCIGAIDGWVVKIRRPNKKDGILNPQSFYSRKGYFAVNVQAVVSKDKRVIARSILARGAEHDSSAFKKSGLHQWCLANWRLLATNGFYFIGDSAYSLRSFLITPFDNAVHGTAEDDYNYFHSSSRISVECTFGEIDLRWGILWRPLHCSLRTNCKIIDACMRLHNFIVDHRENRCTFDTIDRRIFDEDNRRFFASNIVFDGMGVDGGEEDIRLDMNGNILRGGRPSSEETTSSGLGKMWRNAVRDEISRQGLVRPVTNWYRVNNRMVES